MGRSGTKGGYTSLFFERWAMPEAEYPFLTVRCDWSLIISNGDVLSVCWFG